MMLDFSETGDISSLVIGRFIGAAELGEKGRETIDAPPVADPSEIAARPNVRKKVRNLEVKEIRRGPLKKSKSAKPFAAMLRYGPTIL
jgi:hypothetical protein